MRTFRIAASCTMVFLCSTFKVSAQTQAVASVTNCSSFDGTGGLREALSSRNPVHFTCDGIIIAPEMVIASNTDLDATGQHVTLSGNHTNRLFCVSPGNTLSLTGLTISDGQATAADCGPDSASSADSTSTASPDDLFGIDSSLDSSSGADVGGGILNYGTLRVTNTTISHCEADNGGAIANQGGRVTMTHSSLWENAATLNVGGALVTSGAALIDHSTISGNTAKSGGGGIMALNSTLTISGSTLSGNSAGSGGGISVGVNGTLAISGSTLSGNSSSNAGGGLIVITSGSATISNSTFTGNTSQNAGAIFNGESTLTLTNDTISKNAAGDFGAAGGIFNAGQGKIMLKNTIVAGNSAYIGADIFGTVSSQGHNLIGKSADAKGFVNSDLLDVDPKLEDLTGGPAYFPLAADSPAINAGDNDGCPATDERGVARPQESKCDIGAFEFQNASTTNVPIATANESPSQ
ncbi:MAG TPA: choice-of-anchor Q domain-containing protein [Aggregatilineales bacterium]|nr:choice-of-anchor Q domain-containing protein [Aggregatilineales bacterium]